MRLAQERKSEIVENAVFCTVHSDSRACLMARELKQMGIPYRDVSILALNSTGARHFTGRDPKDRNGLLLREIGWIQASGLLHLHGIGSFIAAGPLLQKLNHPVQKKGRRPALPHLLLDLSLNLAEAHTYADAVMEGNVLFAVHTETHHYLTTALDVFRRCKAQHILPVSGVLS